VASQADIRVGPKTVLLVEDDASVRWLARLALELLGHEVLEAADGEEAVRVAQEHPGTIHLLVTDLGLPGLTGETLAATLQPRRPGMKVLFASGYGVERVHPGEEPAFLAKPYTPATLAAKVEEVLAG
jgi:DNA-binding NtrC family response regulator